MLFSQCRSNADEHTLTQISFLTNYECWKNIRSSTLMFKRCFVNVETTSINIRQLNFRFQPDFNVETTLVDRRWIDVMLSTLFGNVETTSINERRLNFHFQPNINVETTLTNVDDQRCFNVESTLMCLLGIMMCFFSQIITRVSLTTGSLSLNWFGEVIRLTLFALNFWQVIFS